MEFSLVNYQGSITKLRDVTVKKLLLDIRVTQLFALLTNIILTSLFVINAASCYAVLAFYALSSFQIAFKQTEITLHSFSSDAVISFRKRLLLGFSVSEHCKTFAIVNLSVAVISIIV